MSILLTQVEHDFVDRKNLHHIKLANFDQFLDYDRPNCSSFVPPLVRVSYFLRVKILEKSQADLLF